MMGASTEACHAHQSTLSPGSPAISQQVLGNDPARVQEAALLVLPGPGPVPLCWATVARGFHVGTVTVMVVTQQSGYAAELVTSRCRETMLSSAIRIRTFLYPSDPPMPFDLERHITSYSLSTVCGDL